MLGGFDSPIAMDLGEGSTFQMHLKGDGNAPLYHYKNAQIPVDCYTGRANHLVKFGVIGASTCASVAGSYMGLRWSNLFFFQPPRPSKAIAWANMAAQFTSLSRWFDKSDLIVGMNSQDIKNTYSDSERKLHEKKEVTHMDIVSKLGDEIPRDMSNELNFGISHIICENQTYTENDIVEYTPVDNIDWEDQNGNVQHYTNNRHSIVQFNGLATTNTAEHWVPVNNGVAQVSLANGRPVTFVGTIDHYFMNRATLTANVNGGVAQPLAFNNQFGKWAGRFIDINGDNNVDESDHPQGSFIFAPVNKNNFLVGQNNFAIKATSPFSKSKLINIAVVYGNPILADESDVNGNPLSKKQFFGGSVAWTAGTNKVFYVVFNRNVSSSLTSQNSVGLVFGTNTENKLQQVASDPTPGQFCVMHASGKCMFKINLDYSNLQRSAGSVENIQTIHLVMEDELTAAISHCFAPSFVIIEEPPQIFVFEPTLTGDFNADGVVDHFDDCQETSQITPVEESTANSICTSEGLTADECNEMKDLFFAHNQIYAKDLGTFCDGEDNDFNGKMEPLDKGEFKFIKYYSPSFAGSELKSPPVKIDFSIKNISDFTYSIENVQWKIYKVIGDNYSSASQLIYQKDVSSECNYDGARYSGEWKFENLPAVDKDGLYCLIISATDAAGYHATSIPAYFVIDTKQPNITILQNWKDDNGGSTFASTSEIFTMKFIPGLGSTPVSTGYDTEADKVKIIFKQFGVAGAPQYSIEAFVDYKDVATYNSAGQLVIGTDGLSAPDGNIDPTSVCITKTAAEMGGIYFVPDGLYNVSMEITDKATNKKIINCGPLHLNRGEVSPASTYINLGSQVSTDFVNNSDGSFAVTTNAQTNFSNTSEREDQLSLVYNYATIEGDFEVNLQVKNYSAADDGLAGLMVRTALDERAPMAALLVTNDGQVTFSKRNTTGQEKQIIANISGYIPPQCYLKLVRTGDILAAYTSSNGYDYVKLGQTTWNNATVYEGTCVIPSGASVIETAQFSKVTYGSIRSSYLFPLKIEVKDNGFLENNITKPQLRITNLSPDLPLSEFRVRLWFSRAEVPSQTILVDKYYTDPDGVQVQVSTCVEDANLVKVDLLFPSNYSLLPGTSTTEQGLQIGVHFNGYYPGQWVKSNDWSCTGITDAWSETQRITVYDKYGTFIYGSEPERSVMLPPPSTPVFVGCESTGDWTLSRGAITTTTNKTEGTYALQISGGGYQELTSKMITTGSFAGITGKIGLDLVVGSIQPNPYWIGEIQIYATCVSANLYNALIGKKDLASIPQGVYSTVPFDLPSAIKTILEQDHSDFNFTVILNTNTSSGPYLIDNLRFR
jgi:hypothetical protein